MYRHADQAEESSEEGLVVDAQFILWKLRYKVKVLVLHKCYKVVA
jgi:hypothetical protein